MKLLKIIQILLIIFFANVTWASNCIFNETKTQNLQNPQQDYKLWSLQKICFDNLVEPTKISTENDLMAISFYKDVDIRFRASPSGRQIIITAIEKSTDRTIEVKLNQTYEGILLAILVKTSDGFELVASL